MATQITTNAGSGYGNVYIDSLIWGNSSWSTDEPIYIGGWSGYSNMTGQNWFSWSEAEMDSFYVAAYTYSMYTNLTFQEVVPSESTSSSNITDIIIYLGDSTSYGLGNGALGMHEIPNGSNAAQGWGDWIGGYYDATHPSWSNLVPGSSGYYTILHEFGHAMGLAHPHDGGDSEITSASELFPGVSSSGDTGGNALNQGIWTVMSYNSDPTHMPSPSYDYGYSQTIMAFDIAALQAMYGANNSYATEDNTYTLYSSNGIGTGWFCIWDAGGIDTITNAGSNQGATINLNDAPLVGEFAGGLISQVNGIYGGYTIANTVVIENAIGGNGNDTITGNSANNNLQGGQGNDTFYIVGGVDVINGGTGVDNVIIDTNFTNITMGVSTDGSVIIRDTNGNSSTITI